VVAISLPRLRGFALHENEHDALRMLGALGERFGHLDGEVHARAPLGELLDAEAELGRRLEDWRALADGRVLRHGYLFDVLEPVPGLVVVRGWPWRHGETGLGAFVWSSRGGLVGHANAHASFSGPYSPPPWPLAAGWSPLAAP
jgi:hypothetical protein